MLIFKTIKYDIKSSSCSLNLKTWQFQFQVKVNKPAISERNSTKLFKQPQRFPGMIIKIIINVQLNIDFNYENNSHKNETK